MFSHHKRATRYDTSDCHLHGNDRIAGDRLAGVVRPCIEF
jgi:hypothetical protein